MLNNNTLIFYAVERVEVETLSYKRIMSFIKELESIPHHGYSSVILNFSGYDHIPDEIYEIMDIRKWVEGLFSRCPHFLYFVTPQDNSRVNAISPYSDVESTYHGERLSANQWVFEKGITDPNDLPEMLLKVNLPSDRHKKMVQGLRKFGFKSKEKERTLEVEQWLEYFKSE